MFIHKVIPPHAIYNDQKKKDNEKIICTQD
jgi:hypothetical protein